MCNSESLFCSCVGLSDHFYQCLTQFLVDITRTLSQILYLDNTYFHRIHCFICCIFRSKFGHTHQQFSLVSIISFQLTKHQTARKKKEKKCHFPTKSCYGVKISPTPNDLKALGDCQMLNTELLDCLLQHSTSPPNEETHFQVYF